MSRFFSGSLVLSLLPIVAVLGVFSLGTTRRDTAPTEAGTLVVYLSPSSATDPTHVIQLSSLLKTIKTYDRHAADEGAAAPSHAGLTAEYRLIVRETTPECILRAGLPLDVR